MIFFKKKWREFISQLFIMSLIIIAIFIGTYFYFVITNYYKNIAISQAQNILNSIIDYKKNLIPIYDKDNKCPIFNKVILDDKYIEFIKITGDHPCLIAAKIKKNDEISSAIQGKIIVLEINLVNQNAYKERCFTNIKKDVLETKLAINHDNPTTILHCITDIPEYVVKHIE